MIKKFSLIELDEVTSTQDVAAQLLMENKVSHGDIIFAKRQTKGRGRYNKSWHSLQGNLFFTIILKPQINEELWPQLSYVAGESLAQALLSIDHNLKVELKWINDILIEDKKVAGILLEKTSSNFLLLGIGINLLYSEELEQFNASSLDKFSSKFNKNILMPAFLERFKYHYNEWFGNGFLTIKNLWKKRAKGVGKEITIKLFNHERKGVFIGIDDNGLLQLLENGSIESFNAGELFF